MDVFIKLVGKKAVDFFFWIFIVYCVAMSGNEYIKRIHGYVWMQSEQFVESNCLVNNPNRGFYKIYGFVLTDEKKDLWEQVEERFQKDSNTLALIQINLCRYTKKPLSEMALQNLGDLFEHLEQLEKQYIVRFLYDWEGRNLETEPEKVETILEHMQQLEGMLKKYSECIFIQQGIFIGNWGEMNNTKHMGSLQQLILQLEAVTGDKTYLAVRAPAYWRIATGQEDVNSENLQRSSLVRRLSLYNDGMLGDINDCGTYSVKNKAEAGIFSAWNREEELAFQEELCQYVPNGGEVIINNPWNDFESAVQNFSTMHVTYLNIDYDRTVLDKWADTIVTEKGIFNGMDGLSYMERHLGYRLLISNVDLVYDIWEDGLKLEISMKNVGFAPLYKEPVTTLIICNKATGEKRKYLLDANLRSLAGGNEKDVPLVFAGSISLEKYLPGEYEIFLSILDEDSDKYIELANEQKRQELGYKLGEFRVDEMIDLSQWSD